MDTQPVEFLLLNASNFPGNPVFPFAFIQVSSIARRNDISIARHDFLNTPRAEWKEELSSLLMKYRPKAVGFHIRQADNQTYEDYAFDSETAGTSYQPIADTKVLIEWTRKQSDAAIVIGGFAVSVHGQRICEFLEPDFVVFGDPDAFFQNFRALLVQQRPNLEPVPNVASRVDNYAPYSRSWFPLSDDMEYDDDIFREVVHFYKSQNRKVSIGGPGEVDFPVEIMRGCPCSCYFCTEPAVKGTAQRTRDLRAVMQDVEFLADRDVRGIWFICSELNMYGMDYPLALADRMMEFNKGRGSRRVLWKAYAMPRPGMTREQIRYMMSTGYVPGWNEFVSFHDRNLRECHMPYRTSDAVRYFSDVIDLSRDGSVYHGPQLQKFEMFLGNATMTPSALAKTLEVVDREGFGSHQFGSVASATRVYVRGDDFNCGDDESVVSFGPNGATGTETLFPTFFHSPSFVKSLGTKAAVTRFLEFVGSTFLSRNFQVTLNIPAYFEQEVTPELLTKHMENHALLGTIATLKVVESWRKTQSDLNSDVGAACALLEHAWGNINVSNIRPLLDARVANFQVRARVLQTILNVLFGINKQSFDRVLRSIDLARETDRVSPYRIMRKLYRRFQHVDEVVPFVRTELNVGEDSLEVVQLKFMLWSNNVHIVPEYAELLFDTKEHSDSASN